MAAASSAASAAWVTALAMTQTGGDVVIQWSAAETITLRGVALAALDATDFLFTG